MQPGHELFSVHFPDPATGFSAGDRGTIVKTTHEFKIL
jgi:hypothetical protein